MANAKNNNGVKTTYAYGYKNLHSYVIWGVGDTPTEAKRDGLYWIRAWWKKESRPRERSKCSILEATPGLQKYLDTHGGEVIPTKFIRRKKR